MIAIVVTDRRVDEVWMGVNPYYFEVFVDRVESMDGSATD